MPLITDLGRQRQEDICEVETNLVYRANSKTPILYTEKLNLGNPKSNQTKTNNNKTSKQTKMNDSRNLLMS